MFDYKRLIKSREIRLKILRLLSFIPDKQMIQLQYRIKLHRKLNLKNPQRFTEKLQWYKLNYRDPLMQKCVDKYDVREYVKECGLESILIPVIGVYDLADELNFDELPDKFVMKDTLGGGGNSVIICNSKSELDIASVKSVLDRWVKSSTSYRQGGREWVYGGKKHRIIVEKLLPSRIEDGGLIDYKFFCFNGIPTYTYVITDREVGRGAELGIYKSDTFEKINAIRVDERPLVRKIYKPKMYDEMMNVAKILSKPFPEVRVDLYCVKDKIYFGELTFFDGSGYMRFDPDQFDIEMGEKFILPNKNI